MVVDPTMFPNGVVSTHITWNAQIKKKRRNNMQKNITTRIVAILLATLMVIGILPFDINAAGIPNSCPVEEPRNNYRPAEQYVPAKTIETNRFRTFSEPSTQSKSELSSTSTESQETMGGPISYVPRAIDDEGHTPDWDDDEQKGRYWPIPYQGRLVKVSTGEPIKNPSLRYIGGYTRPDGREVIRLAFSAYSTAVTGVWRRMVLKPDDNINKLIDWGLSGMGSSIPIQSINNHDRYSFNETFVNFEPLSSQQGGSGNLHVMDLSNSGTGTVMTGSVGSHYEVPIDLVMKAGETVKNLDKNPLIQMRLMDSNFERIYSTTIDTNKEVPYSSYTMSTFVPVRLDLKQGIINTDVVRNYENIMQSASSYIKYNEEKGYFDVYMRRTQGAVGSAANDGGSGVNPGDYGFMQSFDESLIEILKPQDESGTVAQIFMANDNDNIPKSYRSENPTVPKPANRIDYALKDITRKNGVGILKVTSNRPNGIFLIATPTLTTYGYSTVVRYFVDKDKLKEKFGSSDIVSYEFFSTLFATNKTGVEEFKSKPRDEDINLKRGDTIDIRFDGRRDLVTLATFDTQGSFIQIGDDQYKISWRTTADKAKYVGGSGNYMRKMTFWVPFDIKIKKDTPVTIFSRKTKLQEVSPGMTVTFNYSAKNDQGGDITKSKTYRFEREFKDPSYSMNDKGEVFKDGQKVNDPQETLFKDNHDPLIYSRQENFGGGILTRTVDYPDVDELFTNSEYITGRTKYDSANIHLYNLENKNYNRVATITAGSEKKPMVVNGKRVQGYEWTSQDDKSKTVEEYQKLWPVKDTPVYLSNQDVLQNALDNKEKVVEQVQAKVTFQVSDNTSIERIVPLNKEFTVVGPKFNKKGVITNADVVGTENKNYKGNGFKVMPGNPENIKVDSKKPTITLNRQAIGYNQNDIKYYDRSEIYPNFLNHNGRPYDINNIDTQIAKEELDGFMKRLYPDPLYDAALTQNSEGKKRPDDAVVIGWTTKKMVAQDGGFLSLTDGMDQLYKLQRGTNEDPNAFKIRTLDDWKKVDADEGNFVFDEYSPVDKHRTVYAVWGVPSIVLHSNNTEDIEQETTVRIPITRAMFQDTDEAIEKLVCEDLDIITKATERPALDISIDQPRNPNNYHKLTIKLGSNAKYSDANEKKIVYLVKDKNDWSWNDARALAEKLVEKTEEKYKYLRFTNDQAGQDEVKEDFAIERDMEIWAQFSEYDLSKNKCNIDTLKNKQDKYKDTVIITGNLPKAPYLDTDTTKFDERLKNFRIQGQTFVGWKAVKEPNAVNGTIKEQLDKFDAGQQNGRMSRFESSRALNGTERYGYMQSKNSAYLPNGYKLWVAAEDRGLKHREEFFTQVKDVHLYAIYRPYFKVEVDPQYATVKERELTTGDIDPKNIKFDDYGSYDTANYTQTAKHKLKIALITRTAVTPFTDPTVAQSANYNPITDIVGNQQLIQEWDPNDPSSKPTWLLPGYDAQGRRKSYVSVVIPDGKNSEGNTYEQAYKDMGAKFDPNSWKKLGITTYLKSAGFSLDPNAPKNLFYDEQVEQRNKEIPDKYGAALPKEQAFTVKKAATGDNVDIFTAATCRLSQKIPGKQEISGYRIVATIIPKSLPNPEFDRIRDRDDKVTLSWPGASYKIENYAEINKLEVTINDPSYKTKVDGKDIPGRVIVFERKEDPSKPGKYLDEFKNVGPDKGRDGNITAKIVNKKLILDTGNPILKALGAIKPFNTGITMKYIKEDATGGKLESKATESVIPIRTSANVEQMNQAYRADKNAKVKIEFTIPKAIVNQVTSGSKYIAQRWNKDTKKWEQVGETILPPKAGTYDGEKSEIEFDEPVRHGDIIRIVSYENEPSAKPTAEELKANPKAKFYKPEDGKEAEDGFALPNYSTRIANDESIPNVDLPPFVGNNTEGIEYVTIDLEAPEIDGKAKDETFRRTIDLRATFKERLSSLPDLKDGEQIKVEFGTAGDRGNPDNKVMYFYEQNQLLEAVGVVERTEEMEGPNGEGLTGIWVSVVDRFGNATDENTNEGKLDYTQTYQLRVSVFGAKAKVTKLRIKSERENTKITLIYLRNGEEQGTQEVTIQEKDKYQIVDLEVNNEKYKLEKGDEIILKGEASDANKTYTTNPFKVIVR